MMPRTAPVPSLMRNDFFSLAPVGCFVLSAAGHVLDVNPAGAAFLGRERADLCGCAFDRFVEAGDVERFRRYLSGLGSAGASQRIDLMLVRRQGATFRARIEGASSPDHPEAPVRLVLLDGTGEQRTREALTASEARLARIVQEAPLPVAIHTEHGDTLALSRAWTECTGYTREDLATLEDWIRLAYPGPQAGQRKALHEQFRTLLGQHGRLHAGETEIRLRDGSRRLWDFHLATLDPLPDGTRIVMTVAIDVTEQKRVEAELVQARDRAEEMARLKSSFLANMSHEIRTPLTGIIGFAAVLAKELPEEQQEFAELIESSGRRLLDMLNSVLDLAKLEANQVELHLARLDVHDETSHIVRLLQPMAHERGLELRFEVGAGAEHAAAHLDRPALSRILHNLVGNALKFTDRGGVTVGVEADAEHVYLRVADTGIGIDPSFLPHLFDEFRQESTGVDRTHVGSGLGLAITRRLVELLRGEITVQSEKGQGSVFTVAFNRAPDEAGVQEAEAEPPFEQELNGKHSRIRLLLVEDQLDAQFLLLELLDELYDVTVASSATEALHLARRTPFDLILLDIQLGEGPDGTDVLRTLRTLPAYRTTPIVALTAYALPGDRERFLEMGFTDYLSKPFDIDELLRLPARLLAE